MNPYLDGSFQRGFGTWPLRGDDMVAALNTALDVGYRAFDTAQMYGNEADVGAVLAAASVPRDQMLVTTKVHPDNYHPDTFIASVETSLRDLRCDVVDVLLLHWPPADGDIDHPLALLAEAREKELARHIGVSNFNAGMMNRAKALIDPPVVCNQVEFHPLLDQSTLLETSAATGIGLVAYCSVARGRIFDHAEFAEIGAAHGKSAAQVALRWILQKGVAINTMSTKPENIRANFDIMDFALDDAEMQRIDTVSRLNQRIVDSSVVPWAPAWD